MFQAVKQIFNSIFCVRDYRGSPLANAHSYELSFRRNKWLRQEDLSALNSHHWFANSSEFVSWLGCAEALHWSIHWIFIEFKRTRLRFMNHRAKRETRLYSKFSTRFQQSVRVSLTIEGFEIVSLVIWYKFYEISL